MAAELLAEYEPEISELILVPSDGGSYEVSIDDHLIYSKLQTHRHADPGEILGLLRRYIDHRS